MLLNLFWGQPSLAVPMVLSRSLDVRWENAPNHRHTVASWQAYQRTRCKESLHQVNWRLLLQHFQSCGQHEPLLDYGSYIPKLAPYSSFAEENWEHKMLAYRWAASMLMYHWEWVNFLQQASKPNGDAMGGTWCFKAPKHPVLPPTYNCFEKSFIITHLP